MDASTVDELAQEIYRSERAGVSNEPLSTRHADLTAPLAYAIQEGYASLRTENGARLIGRKIGCTNKAIQGLFGITTPDFGHLFDDMVVPDRGDVIVHELIAPMVEPELTFLLDKDVKGPGAEVSDVLQATSAILPSLEVIDSRIRDWEIAFVDTVADNGSSARCVFGRPVPYRPTDAGIDLRAEKVQLLRNGEEFDSGLGEAVLGHPAAAVAWLANSLSEYGRWLRAGDYVMSGSMTRAARVESHDLFEAVFDNFGTVSCRFR